jgi:nickel-dependent lactate racemase
MPILVNDGAADRVISPEEQRHHLQTALESIADRPRKVLLVPPDISRKHSQAGPLAVMAYELLGPDVQVNVMPAIGTHFAMTDDEIATMFGDTIPRDRFLDHDWRNGVESVGVIPSALVAEWSDGGVNYDIEVSVDRELIHGGYDLVLSLGQIVPHEVVGMANYSKNIIVGLGGADLINRSHYLGSVHGAERTMGRIDTPVRRILNYALHEFLGTLPIWFVFTVMELDTGTGKLNMRGMYVGDDDETFASGARLSQQVNLNLLEQPLHKVVVYLEADEFKSTWLGNKAVYRTRMAIADGGELLVLAPGLREFGEDRTIDALLRKYGYLGTPETIALVAEDEDLGNCLGAAAHMMHGSSEGRFSITYCPGEAMGREEIESVGYLYADLGEMLERYPPDQLDEGFNTMPDGEEIYFISNPALGLWALQSDFPG